MSLMKGIEKKRGNRLGFWFFRTLVRTVGLRGAYGFVHVVSMYYLLFDRGAVAVSMAYVKRRFPGRGIVRRMSDVYRLFVSQGISLIDRFVLAAGYSGIHIEMRGYDKIRGLFSDPAKGFILLTAHVGNWQAAMKSLKGFGRTVYLMMRREDNAAVKEALNIDSEEEAIKILYTDDSLGGVIEAMRAINSGGLVAIMGDRTYDYSSMETTFLGGSVRFPYGVFSLAAAVRCPVVLLLTAKVGLKKYITDVSHVIQPPGGRGSRDEAVKDAIMQFARILEGYVAEYPYQWFVFQDIWSQND